MTRRILGRRAVVLVAGIVATVAALLAPATAAPATAAPAAVTGPPEQRAAALVARMTLDEKIAMVHGDAFPTGGTYAGHVPGVPRLGIPDLYLADGPNGVGNGSTGVTQFPAAVTTAASWDPGLADRFGTALGAEQRGKGHNVALAPTINILRTPLWGREAETYTEDPYLNARTAVAEVRGIQSQHVIATAKHYVANNQETGRLPSAAGPSVDELIGERALQEIYYPGFRAAVQQGGAGSVMCAYQQVNGAYACENADTFGTLKRQWGFSGFVMSDWFATQTTVQAALAGLDMEMPIGAHFGAALKQAVLSGQVPPSRLDDMVRRILTSMIRIGVLDRPVDGVGAADVSTPAHQQLARRIAEQGSVLLKNAGGVLPLGPRVRSLAVIGAAASETAQYSEGGSGAVIPSRVVSPLDGIRARAGSTRVVTYAPGTVGTATLPLLTGPALGTGLRATYYPSTDWTGAPVATRVEPAVDVSGAPVPGLPAAWSARWTGTLTPPATGDYLFSVTGAGAFRMWVGGRLVANLKYADFAGTVRPAPVRLTAGRPVSIRVDYSSAHALIGPALRVGWQPPDPALRARAVAAARAADVAVVVVSDVTGEGSDRTSLALPGDQDQLVAAVARANPRTVVVLNTGGPVLAPWLGQVGGVLETWYPGQEYGGALAALLFGDANPSGKLPMTWPASPAQGPASDYRDLGLTTERYAEGVLVGYRWYDATGQRPLFPFGYGLSYTSFRYGGLRVAAAGGGQVVAVRVTNTGRRTGSEVAQLYLGSPAAAQEPPKQLKGYAKVTLRPGETRTVTFRLGSADLAAWSAGRWVVAPGRYQALVGSSSRDIRAWATFTVH